MKEYEVKFIKVHTYRVKANSFDKAIDMACELDEKETWDIDPADEIETEELGEVKK